MGIRVGRVEACCLAVAAGAVLAIPRSTAAGNGQVKERTVGSGEVADVEATFYFAFPPSLDQVERAKEQLNRASELLCDATDGAVKITKVDLGTSEFAGKNADIYWYPDEAFGPTSFGKTSIPFGDPGNYTRIAGGNTVPDDAYGNDVQGLTGTLLAHELGHGLLGLYDGYGRQRRWGQAYGFGPSFDYDQTPTDTINSLMRDSGGQHCYDRFTGMRGVSGGNAVKCIEDAGCQEVNPDWECPPEQDLNSELLTDAEFDSVNFGDGNLAGFPGPQRGEVLNLQVGLLGDHPINAFADWSTFTSFDDAEGFYTFSATREYVDEHGYLRDGKHSLDGDGDYTGSSHDIRFYFVHHNHTSSVDLWRVYALIDQREVSGDFSVDEAPQLLQWDVAGGTANFLELDFSLSAPYDYFGAQVQWTDENDVPQVGRCYEASSIGGQTFDYSTGTPTSGAVKLLMPSMTKDDPTLSTSAQSIDVRLFPTPVVDQEVGDTLTTCAWSMTQPLPPKELAIRQGPDWVWDEDRWFGLGFYGAFSSGEFSQQLGECAPGSTCLDDGYPILWKASRERWEGALGTVRMKQKLTELESALCLIPNTLQCKEEFYIDQIRTAPGVPKKGAEWDWLEFRLNSRWHIDVSEWKPQTAPVASATAHSNCDDAGNITFTGEDNLDDFDTILVLFDRSYSMKKEASPGGGRRNRKIEWARAAVYSWFEYFAETNSNVKVGLRVFAEDSELPLAPGRIVADSPTGDEILLDDANKVIADIEFDEFTAIGDAVNAGITDLNEVTNAQKKALFLLTDGKSNRGETCDQAWQDADAAEIPIFWTPIGNYAFNDPACDPSTFGDHPGNGIFDGSNPRNLPTEFMKVLAEFRGWSMAGFPQHSEVGHALIGVPQQETFSYDVEKDAVRLIIQMTNNTDALSTWEPLFELRGPQGELFTEASAEWNLLPRKHVGQIIVTAPTEGTWELTMDGGQITKGVSERAIIMPMIDNTGPQCDLATTSQYLEDEEVVQVFISSSFRRAPISSGVDYTVEVVRPDGTVEPVVLSTNEEGASGIFSAGIGNGIYKVQGTCDVGDFATYVGTESGDGEVLSDERPPSFKRVVEKPFYVSTDRYYMPTLSGDCDQDGYTDGEEGAVVGTPYVDAALMTDTDGDGVPDACDPDSDDDGRSDAMEPDQDLDSDGMKDRVDVDSDDDGDMDGQDDNPNHSALDRAVVRADFDGDGEEDEAVGDYTFNNYEGIVRVYYGDDTNYGSVSYNRDTGSLLGSDDDYDYFGRALAAGDLDGDGYDDLVVGVPGDDVGGHSNAGSIHVIYGSATGLVTTGGDQLLHQDSPGLLGVVEDNDYYGERLAIGDFNCDGRDDLVIGVPREGISQTDTGIIAVIYGSLSGLSTTDAQWYQGTSGVDGVAESYDKFGEVLKIGDFDGNGCSDLAVGVPFEDLNSTPNTGYVYTMVGGVAGLDPANGDYGFFQSTLGIPDTAEAYDEMGDRFWITDWDGDGYDDLTSLVPGDGCGAGTKGFLVTYGGAGGVAASGSQISCLSAFQELDL